MPSTPHFAADRFLSVNNVDLSEAVTSLELKQTAETVETTTTQSTNRTYIASKPDVEVTVTFNQDLSGEAGVYDTLKAAFGQSVPVVMRPDFNTAGETWTGDFVISENVPIPGGESTTKAMFTVTWKASGPVTN